MTRVLRESRWVKKPEQDKTSNSGISWRIQQEHHPGNQLHLIAITISFPGLQMKFVVFFFFLCTNLYSQEMAGPQWNRNSMGDNNRGMREASLQGQVLQHDGKPVTGITVRINGLSHIEEAVTDNQGQFQISSLPSGTYDVEATQGTASARQTVILTQGSSNVTLQFDGTAAPEGRPGTSISAQQLKVPDKARKKYEKAMEDMAKHDTEKAFHHLAEALAGFACYADALTMKSVLDFTAGRTEAAAGEAQQAIHCDGSNAKAYFILGAVFNAQGQNENAIQTLSQGIRFQPEAWQPYYELGKSFLALHRGPDAVAQLHRAAELAHNSFPPVYAALAAALLQVKDYVSARTQYLLFLKAAPNSPEADKVKQVVSQIEARLHSNPPPTQNQTQR